MKKFYVSVVALLLAYGTFAQSPTMTWGYKIGGLDNDIIQTTCSDPNGNVYIGGSFKDLVDFDPGAGQIEKQAADITADAFIAKYNSAGVFQWVVTFGDINDDEVLSITADANNVYATGYFNGDVDFNPNGTPNLKSGNGGKDIFVAKYSASNGALLFARTFGSFLDDQANTIAIDPSSNIYITGYFQDDINFDPALSAAGSESSIGDEDMFLAKYTSAGTFVWSNSMGSVNTDIGRSCFASATEVWIAGDYSGVFFPDPNSSATTAQNLGGRDGFFAKYNLNNGALLDGGFIRSTDDDVITSIAYNATTNSLYTAGHFSGTATMFGNLGTNQSVTTNGLTDCFVARHDASDMKLKWINSFGGIDYDFLNWMFADGGNVYALGAFSATMDVDPSGGVKELTNNSVTYDAFAVKYNYINGAHVDSFGIGSGGPDQFTSGIISGGYIVPVGTFSNIVDINPGPPDQFEASSGGADGLMLQFKPNEPLSPPSGLNFPSIGTTTFSVAFTPVGFPDGYITVFKTGSAPTGTPVDGIVYAQGNTIGDATVLFVGPQPAYNVVSATPGTQYFITVYPYNGSGTTIDYKIDAPLSSAVATTTPAVEPVNSPTGFVASDITKNSYTITFTAAAGSPGGYIAIRTTGTPPNTDPTDGVSYVPGATVGNGIVAFVGGLNATGGTSVVFAETGLAAGTQYFYKIYSFNGSGGTINYKTTIPAAGDVTTRSLAAEPTTPPSNLAFINVRATSFGLTFDASTSANVSGYLGVRATGAAPTFVPQDGIEYNVGDGTNGGINGEVIAFNSSDTFLDYEDGDLTANTTYFFKIYVYNGTGDEINYMQVNPLSGSQKTNLTDVPPDDDPPVIVDNTVTTIAPNAKLLITVNVTDASDIAEVYVNYYPINSIRDGYGNLQQVGTSNTWTFEIDASYNTEQGVEYSVQASDEHGNTSPEVWKSVIVTYAGDGLTIPYTAGKAKENYRIISVPLNLSKKSVSDVFADDLGEYAKSKYRLFRYNGSSTSELSSSSTLDLGRGYWFIASESKTVDTGPGTTALAGINKPITIPITTGWNQIGNPFNFDVAWDAVVGHDDNAEKTFGPFKTFDGRFNNATTLRKMSGGFLMVQGAGNGQLRIPVDKDASRSTQPAPPVNFAQALGSDTWGVDIRMRSGSYENTFAGFGMHPHANEQNDVYDDFTLPRFMDYLELNYNKKLFGSPFTKDIVPTSAEHVWEFNVESNLADEIIELRWDNSYFGSTDLQLVLWDVEQQRAIDMKSENTYAFERSQSGVFKIFFGNEAFVKTETVPYRAVFHSASPVPSSGNVTFAFSVPESRGDVNTTLVIYNMMGQKVADLVNRPLSAGYQQATWNIEDGIKPAAGMYISVLKFGDTTLQKRLIIR